MKLTKISLLNFRNFSKLSLKLGNNLNVFIGDNAQGKTNILESIYVLALTKSHRTGVNPNMIKFDRISSSIKGVVKKDQIISKLEVDINNNEKKYYINKTEIKKLSDYISNLNVILFTPDDLEIIKGSPNIRRNLLNIQLSQISKVYLNTYNEYNKILKTRNEYLKILFNNSIADKKYLDIITDKLIEKAIIIYEFRNDYLNFINQNIDNYYKKISKMSGLRVVYNSNVILSNLDKNEQINKMKKIFNSNYQKELNYGMTMFGPHRDDFYFEFDNNDLKYFGSQGQQKLAILSYKLAEIPIFTQYSGTSPLVLLDDIFSELDIKKRNRLLEFIIENNVQTIITTTDLKNISKKYLEEAYIYEVKNGNIDRK